MTAQGVPVSLAARLAPDHRWNNPWRPLTARVGRDRVSRRRVPADRIRRLNPHSWGSSSTRCDHAGADQPVLGEDPEARVDERCDDDASSMWPTLPPGRLEVLVDDVTIRS